MELRYRGLASEQFAHLFGLSDEALEAHNVRRMIVDEKPGYPCRVTLQDAERGERVLLLPYEHHPVDSPYRASGPIFVREGIFPHFNCVGDPPPVLAGRTLSARAYAQDGMMIDADVLDGGETVPVLQRLFRSARASYVHVHFARRGCFACRVERA